jgi:hypothetical protein
MGEDAVLNRIVLGAIRREVGDPNFQLEPIGKRLQVLLKQRRA